MVKGARGSIDRLQRAAVGGGQVTRSRGTRQGKQGYSQCSYMISVIYERSVAKLALTSDIRSLFMITFFSLLYFFLQELNYTTCQKTFCDMKHSFLKNGFLFFFNIRRSRD